MRYVQLRAFHHVAISGGFSRAADLLFLTQPAVSDQVKKLEEEYEVLLFKRRNKRIALTPTGARLLEITRRMFDSEQQAQDLLSESKAFRSGTLRIVADSALHLTPILPLFRDRYPGVTVLFQAGNTDTVQERLRSYDADIGVLGEVPTGREFDVLPLNATPIVAFAVRGHPITRSGALTLAEIAAFPLVLRENGSRTRMKLEEAAASAGIALRPAIEAEGREAVREIVASGAGVGFVSQAEFGSDPRLMAVPLAGVGQVEMQEALICLHDRRDGKLIRAFFEIARETAAASLSEPRLDRPAAEQPS